MTHLISFPCEWDVCHTAQAGHLTTWGEDDLKGSEGGETLSSTGIQTAGSSYSIQIYCQNSEF